MSPSHRFSHADLPETVRAVLASRGLSLAEIAHATRVRFADNPLFRIPPNFYDALRHAAFSPRVHQVFALSVLSGYRLTDWLSLFGFSFDDAAQFQVAWSRYHTAELDARVYDPSAEVFWFEERQPVQFGTKITPVSHWLSGRMSRSLHSLPQASDGSFRYIKVGFRDAYAFPDLLPGSVVRIDCRASAQTLLSKENRDRILAIEHSRGLVCSRIRPGGRGRVVLCPRQLPYAPVELQIGTEARILGAVDLEIRPLACRERPEVSRSAARLWSPGTLHHRSSDGLGKRIRDARHRSGLSLREASARTKEISKVLRHPNYFCAASALSDMEAYDRFPRHIHKLISISAVYCLSLHELVGLGGLNLENAGQEVMPDKWRSANNRKRSGQVPPPSRFLETVQDRFDEIPYFLRGALPTLLSLPNLSVRDFFWAGATHDHLHPYLRDSVFFVVNRRSKVPAPSLSAPDWAQPLYVLELRDGNRLCAPCTLQNGNLVIRQCTPTSGAFFRLRNPIDAEILGKVVAIVRHVLPPRDADAIH